ncbi:MAG: hypothetical protein JWL80_545 [Parcubacteria group bacterium]|nr:hypothetical protein [Parcubacteria group bacterium]
MFTVEEKISEDRLKILRAIARSALPGFNPTPPGEGSEKEELKFEFTFRIVAEKDRLLPQVTLYPHFEGLADAEDHGTNLRLYRNLTRKDSPYAAQLLAILPRSPLQFSFDELQE